MIKRLPLLPRLSRSAVFQAKWNVTETEKFLRGLRERWGQSLHIKRGNSQGVLLIS